jgi:nucleotide-binding universal stress UspA family protein/predicted transcriptional regulator
VEWSATAADESHLSEVRDHLSRLASAFPNNPVETVVRAGHATEEVLALASERDRPLLVLCSHTRTGLDRVLYGSVAGDIVRRASCPVLVVRGPQAAAEQQPTLTKVVAPLDKSPFAEHALAVALAALGPADLDVHLVHVVEPSSRAGLPPAEVGPLLEPKLTGYLREVERRLTDRGYRVTTEVRYGHAMDEIPRVATEQGADMVVIATHGSSGHHPILLGSVARCLLATSPVPLLVARPATVGQGEHETSDAQRATGREPLSTVPSLMERSARELMVYPVVAASEETPLEDVALAMVQHRIGCVPIVDGGGQLVGIVTESDFLRAEPGVPLAAYQVSQQMRERVSAEAIEEIYRAGRELQASQIMSQPVTSVTEDTPVGDVATLLLERRLNQVPVEREGAPVGIVARRDLLRLLLPAGVADLRAPNGGR